MRYRINRCDELPGLRNPLRVLLHSGPRLREVGPHVSQDHRSTVSAPGRWQHAPRPKQLELAGNQFLVLVDTSAADTKLIEELLESVNADSLVLKLPLDGIDVPLDVATGGYPF
jgi:hypothetical protein